MRELELGSTDRISFVMANSSGVEVSGLGTGFTLSISKNGGAFAASSGTKAEISDGWYSYAFTADELDTAGSLAIKVTGAGCSQQNLEYLVRQAVDADVWDYGSRTLTQYAVTGVSYASTKITRMRGDTWSIPVTGLGSVSGYTTIDFMIKGDRGDTDASSLLWVRLNASGLSHGLLRLNAAAPASPVVSTDGSITIDDAAAGDITIAVAARATALLVPGPKHYDVQKIVGATVTTEADGTFVITGDVTRSVS